jgi:signal transduction histidine kinase
MPRPTTTAPRRSAGKLPWKALVEERNKIIALMASATSLSETLNAIAAMIEKLAPPALCSILLLEPDGKHLRHGAGPSLPEEYSRAINGLEIGPSVGSCGTAVYRKKPVIVSDIVTDPLWEGPRAFALSFGLRACWSMPVISDAGTVLGTIAMYYRAPRKPSKRDFGLLQPGASLVRLALAQHRKEEELRAAEARSRLAAEAADLGTYDIDLISAKISWSPRYKAIFGFEPTVEPSHELLVARIHPDDRARFEHSFAEWIGSGQREPRSNEYRILRADNEVERLVALPGRILVNAQGVASRATGVCMDMTEQRKAERKQHEAQQQIHELQKMEALGQLAGGLAHDLNNTLMPILGLSQLALQQISPLDPLREHLTLIHRSGARARDLVNQILTFSRKGEIARGPVTLKGLIEESVSLIRATIPRPISIVMRIDSDVAIWANHGQIDQVLTNLLTNAVQAIGSRPGTIRIELGVATGENMARLSVVDDGPGIAPNVQQRLFEPFFTTKPIGEGTGLGLAVAHGIVTSHGGRIEVSSSLGKGATFTIYLPLLKLAETEPSSAMPQPA